MSQGLKSLVGDQGRFKMSGDRTFPSSEGAIAQGYHIQERDC